MQTSYFEYFGHAILKILHFKESCNLIGQNILPDMGLVVKYQ